MTDLTAQPYLDLVNNDRNVSDKLSQDSSLKSSKSFFNPCKDLSHHRSLISHVVGENILVAYIPLTTNPFLVQQKSSISQRLHFIRSKATYICIFYRCLFLRYVLF